ncbi:hypothetical protein MPER_07110 [Moniliophthora perniciosa FA553]|nr:hypothetical protein MPER_07110 [Moniliophthora perniciosa FA553]
MPSSANSVNIQTKKELNSENYTRKPPPVPEDMKDHVCVWGFVLTKATLGSCSPNTREETERCRSVLEACDEVGIGSPQAQITYGNGDRCVLGWAEYSPYHYNSLGLPPVTVSVPSEEKIEELRKKIHLEGEPKWVYRF